MLSVSKIVESKKRQSDENNLEDDKHDNKCCAAREIAANEIACRKELHEIQMAVERQKLKILEHKLNKTVLKGEILKHKLLHYTTKQ